METTVDITKLVHLPHRQYKTSARYSLIDAISGFLKKQKLKKKKEKGIYSLCCAVSLFIIIIHFNYMLLELTSCLFYPHCQPLSSYEVVLFSLLIHFISTSIRSPDTVTLVECRSCLWVLLVDI